KLAVPGISLHDLRHTHATLLLKAGVPVKVVSERLGHASAAFTMTVYQHVLPGMQSEAAELFAELVGIRRQAASAEPPRACPALRLRRRGCCLVEHSLQRSTRHAEGPAQPHDGQPMRTARREPLACERIRVVATNPEQTGCLVDGQYLRQI